MANTDAAFGLRPIAHPQGLSKARVRAYAVASDYSTALFVGDPVIKTSTANDAEVTAVGVGTLPIGSISEVEKATVGDANAVTGVIVGVAPVDGSLNRTYLPADTGGVVYVNDDPYTEFEIQADGSITETSIGLNAVLKYTNSGSTVTGLSGAELDSGTTTAPAADASYQLTILGIQPRTDNATGVNAKLRVRINNHSEAHASIGY